MLSVYKFHWTVVYGEVSLESQAGRVVGLFSDTWNYIENLSSDTVPNHTSITTNHQALFIYNRTKITGWFPMLRLKNFTEQPYRPSYGRVNIGLYTFIHQNGRTVIT